MKAFLAAIVAIAAITVLTNQGLIYFFDTSTAATYSAPSADIH